MNTWKICAERIHIREYARWGERALPRKHENYSCARSLILRAWYYENTVV